MNDRIFLKPGAHRTLADGGCVMEFAAWVAGETHSDRPRCVSPVIAVFLRRLNDRLADETRQQLVPYAISVIGTHTGADDDRVRAYLCADWACRTAAPWWMERAGMNGHAVTLRTLPAVADRATALAARQACRAAYAAAAADAYAAADANAAAAYAAAADAAAAAANAAAADAYAAAAAAAYAAAADAYAAAAAASDAALLPSALALVDRMVAVGRKDDPEMVEERRATIAACVV